MITTQLKNFSWKLVITLLGCLSLLTACADNPVKKRGPASSAVEQQVVILDFLDSGLTANHKTWEVFAEVFSNVVQEIAEVRLVEKKSGIGRA